MLRPYVLQVVLPQLPSHRRAADGQHPAEVALHQRAHGPAAERPVQPPARGADAALPTERDGSPARPHRPFRHAARRRGPNRAEHVLRGDGPGPDVVQEAVVGLGYDGIGGAHVGVPGEAEQVGEDRVRRARDAQRACQDDRRLELAQLVHLRRSGELTEAVPHDDRRGHLLAKHVAAVRQDRGDPRVDRVTPDHGRVAHPHAVHVGDGIERAGGKDADDDADVPRSGPRRLAGKRCAGEGQEQEIADCGLRIADWVGLGSIATPGLVVRTRSANPQSAIRNPQSVRSSCVPAPRKLPCPSDFRPLTTEDRVTLDEAKAALQRGRHLVLVLPPAVEQAEALWEFIVQEAPGHRPGVSPRVLIICADDVSAAEWASAAPAPVRIHAVTGLSRATHILKERAVPLLAGAVQDLAALLARSVLKLDAISTVVVAWPEALVSGEHAAALDTLLAEAHQAQRVVLSWNPAALGDFLERHARRALVVGASPAGPNGAPPGPVGPARYTVVARGRRHAAVRTVLEALGAQRPFLWDGDR